MTLAPYVRILGRGPGRARALTEDEAFKAMRLILSGDAAPEAVGALLMLMRYRGESAPEIAGFTRAVLDDLGSWKAVPATLDWPSYAAGRTRGRPLFLLSAKLLAAAGQKVLLHGWNSHQSPLASVNDALASLDIPAVSSPHEATARLETCGIAYVPLEAISRPGYNLIRLRDILGLRSCVNTVLRMLNPAEAMATVQGVFHPSYRDLQQDAGALLGRSTILVVKGGGGEFERHPGKLTQAYGLLGGAAATLDAAPLLNATRRLHEPDHPTPPLADLWHGTAQDPFAEAVVVGTAGLALIAAGLCQTPAEGDAMARDLWTNRAQQHAARPTEDA
ncbi:glycosyl transferase family protein [Actibacterium sp. 188UL27-1]|uniref:glycosyl transferase family protein n=1 Tax=Actibacterium sp. 188UL27-1 TaxID=2786961 RepID=UPI0019560F6D|nr:glycosyl transferase family protein [Actibacterium sp. 188UL27-1]MBM7068879.1 glycosyl transferase family protein [Actibacterium sp. 188UL27-1]